MPIIEFFFFDLQYFWFAHIANFHIEPLSSDT